MTDDRMIQGAHSRKFLPYSPAPGTKKKEMCQHAQMTPRIMLDVEALLQSLYAKFAFGDTCQRKGGKSGREPAWYANKQQE